MNKYLKNTLYNEKKAILNVFHVIRKNKIDIIALLIVCIIFHVLIVNGMNFVKCLKARDFAMYKVKNFILYKDDFEYFVKKFYRMYEDANDCKDVEYINFHTYGWEWRADYVCTDKSENYSEYIPMSETDIERLEKIMEAFAQTHENSFYGVIIVNDKSIDFLGTRATSVLYKTKGFFPKVNIEKENCSYYYLDVFACPGWYHVLRNFC